MEGRHIPVRVMPTASLPPSCCCFFFISFRQIKFVVGTTAMHQSRIPSSYREREREWESETPATYFISPAAVFLLLWLFRFHRRRKCSNDNNNNNNNNNNSNNADDNNSNNADDAASDSDSISAFLASFFCLCFSSSRWKRKRERKKMKEEEEEERSWLGFQPSLFLLSLFSLSLPFVALIWSVDGLCAPDVTFGRQLCRRAQKNSGVIHATGRRRGPWKKHLFIFGLHWEQNITNIWREIHFKLDRWKDEIWFLAARPSVTKVQ